MADASTTDLRPFNFQNLPAEILLMITDWLSDKDVTSLMATRKALYETYAEARTGLWKARFITKFDADHFVLPSGDSIFDAYAARHRKSVPIGFMVRGNRAAWSIPSAVMKQLINEATFTGPLFESKNLSWLRKITGSSQVLDVIGRPDPGSLNQNKPWAIVQLVLLHLVLDLSRPKMAYCFIEAAAYAFGDPRATPLFSSCGIETCFDLDCALGILNFFKTCLCMRDDLRNVLESLPPILRPQPWHRRFGTDGRVQPPGLIWKGAISYADKDVMTGVRQERSRYAADLDDFEFPAIEEGVQTLFLSFDPALLPHDDFPPEIIQLLNPYGTSPPRARNQVPGGMVLGQDYAMCVGHYREGRSLSLVVGVLTPVPGQDGIGGWQRLVMVAYDDPAPHSINRNIGAYLISRMPRGIDPVDEAARLIEEDRYLAPVGSEQEVQWRTAVGPRMTPAEAAAAIQLERKKEQDKIREDNNEVRRLHRHMVESFTKGAAREYWKNHPWRRPQLATDIHFHGDMFSRNLSFEGLVLPGGNAMLGRHWNLHERLGIFHAPLPLGQTLAPDLRLDSGPFLFWNTDLGLSYGGP